LYGQVENAAASKLFAVVWMTALRPGELLALTVSDLNFANQTIRMN
jgi:integrase